MLGEVREGLAVVFGNPLLRSIAGCTATSNLFSNALQVVFILYATRQLLIEPALLGIILASAGFGALLGSVLAGRIARAFGLGATIVGSSFLGAAFGLLIPLAAGPLPVVVGMLMLAMFAIGVSGPVYNVNQVSLRQAITPDHLLGRMNASMRFLVWGTIPIGALLGGALGDTIGWWPTLLLTSIGQLLAPLWVFFSPVRGLREQPAPIAA